MKIQFKKPHHKYSYFPGDIVDFEKDEAEKLINSGYASESKKEDSKKVETATIKGSTTADIKPSDAK